MNKRELVQEITNHLAGELAGLEKSEPTSPRVADLMGLLTMYRFMPLPDYGSEDVACPAALVEIEAIASTSGAKRPNTQVLIVPKGGGLVLAWEGMPVQVVTPESPLGGALLGHKAGDSVDVHGSAGIRKFRVVRIR